MIEAIAISAVIVSSTLAAISISVLISQNIGLPLSKISGRIRNIIAFLVLSVSSLAFFSVGLNADAFLQNILFSIGGGLIVGSIVFLFFTRLDFKRPLGPVFQPDVTLPIEEIYPRVYTDEDGDSDGFSEPIGWSDSQQMKKQLLKDIENKHIVDVRDDDVFNNREEIVDLVDTIFNPQQTHQTDRGFEYKLMSVYSDIHGSGSGIPVGEDDSAPDGSLATELKTLRDTHGLNHAGNQRNTAQRLVQSTIQYLEGTQESSKTVEVFEDAIVDLDEKEKIETRITTTNQHIPNTDTYAEVAEFLREQGNSLETNQERIFSNATNQLFQEIARQFEDCNEYRSKYLEYKDEAEQLEGTLTKLDSELDTEWIEEKTDAQIDDTPGAIVETGFDDGVVGELVVKESAKSISRNPEKNYNRGSLAYDFLSTLSKASTKQDTAVKETLQNGVDTIQEYSLITSHFAADLTKSDVEQRGKDVIRTATKLDIPGIEKVVESQVEDELRSLRTIREEDFVSLHITHQRFELLEDVLEVLQSEKERDGNDESEAATSEAAVKQKRQEVKSRIEKSDVRGTGAILSKHFLDLASELENKAHRSDSDAERESLFLAAEMTADYILEMYRDPDLEDALVFLDT